MGTVRVGSSSKATSHSSSVPTSPGGPVLKQTRSTNPCTAAQSTSRSVVSRPRTVMGSTLATRTDSPQPEPGHS